MLRKLLAILLSFTLLACTTMSTITTDPPGATIRINGVASGQTPATLALDDAVWNSSRVELSLPGYKTQVVALYRQISVPRLVVGLFLFWPLLLWVTEHQPVYHFQLEPDNRGAVLSDTPGYFAFKARNDALEVRINGEDLPADHVAELKTGEYELTFVQAGLEVGNQRVTIYPGELTQLYLGEAVR